MRRRRPRLHGATPIHQHNAIPARFPRWVDESKYLHHQRRYRGTQALKASAPIVRRAVQDLEASQDLRALSHRQGATVDDERRADAVFVRQRQIPIVVVTARADAQGLGRCCALLHPCRHLALFLGPLG